MADISVTVGMDKSQFDSGLREVRAQAAAASGAIGQSFSIAGAKMQGIVDPLKKFNAGLASGVSAVTGLIGPIGAAIGLATAGISAITSAHRKANEEARKYREEWEAINRSLKEGHEQALAEIADRSLGKLQQEINKISREYAKQVADINAKGGGYERLLALVTAEKNLNEQISTLKKDEEIRLRGVAIYLEAQKKHDENKLAVLEQEKRLREEIRTNQIREDLALQEKALEIELLRAKGLDDEAKKAQARLDAERAILEIQRQAVQTEEERARRIAKVREIEAATLAGIGVPAISPTSGIAPENIRSFGPGTVNSGLAERTLGRGDSIPAEILAGQRKLTELVHMKLSELVSISKETLLATKGGARA